MSTHEVAALARQLEEALADQLRHLMEALRTRLGRPEAGVLEVAGGLAAWGGEGSPLNQAFGLGLEGPVSPWDVEALEDFIGRAGTPVRVQLLPFADPSLSELLGERGYRVLRFLQMLVREVGPADLSPPVAGVEVRRATEGEARLWARTVLQAFFEREEVGEEELLSALPTAYTQGTTCWLAWEGDTPIGAGAHSVYGRVANLFYTGVRPEYRRRGVQAALIRARLQAAAQAGCTLACCSAQPATGSQRNLERAGFRILYPKVILQRG
jgi:GNAT superfamily N-acetyltransferase